MRRVVLATLLLAGCQSKSIPVRWSAGFLEAPPNADLTAEFNRRFDEPVEVRRGDSRGQVIGCATAIDLLDQGYEPTTSVDSIYLKNAALTCKILREITQAQPSSRSYLSDLQLDAAVAPLLPAELEIGAQAQVDGEDALVAHPPGLQQRLEILARGDFNADGIEDWLVREESWATAGTTREIRAFELTREASGAPLRLLKEL